MRVAYAYLKRVAAGAVFGLYMAYLLYFLNPQIEITPGRIAAAVCVYALICGILFGSMLWGIRWLRVRLVGRGDAAARRHGFGSVTAAAFVSAVVYWAHLALLRIYLPRGAIRILSKATLLIGATAIVLFVIWLLERNAGRRTARVFFLAGCIAVLASALILYQRREGYRAATQEAVYAELGTLPGQRQVIVVAIRSLPHDWVVTLIGEGRLPNFKRLAEESYMTRIEPFRTSSPKAIWASLATGQLPYRHGVTGRFSYRTLLTGKDERLTLLPSGVGFRAWGLIPPVERLSAQLPSGESLPLWSLFGRVGFPSAVINWNGTHPARPGSAAWIVSDRFLRDGAAEGVWPAARAAARVPLHNALVRRLNASTRRMQPQVGTLIRREIEADAAAVTAAAKIARDARASLVAVALNALAETVEALERSEQALPPAESVAGEIIRIELEQIDRYVGTLREANPAATLFVVSPSAVQPPPLPISLRAVSAILGESDDPGRNDGFLIIAGEPVQHRANPVAGEVVDIVPTVLFAAGLPVARDFDGRVLTDPFRDDFLRDNPLALIPTYEASRLVVRR